MSSEVMVRVSKVSERGAVQLPLDVRELLDLTPGTRMVMMTTENAIVLRRADLLLGREPPAGLLTRIRAMFSKVPIRDIEQ